MNLEKIAQLLNCNLTSSQEISSIEIDSRKIKPGCLFVALKGERFDGHDFIPEVIKNGAAAVLCERTIPNSPIPLLQVKDTLKALAILATAHRKMMTCPAIALTGSNGKTTVKEMIAAILPQPAHATHGNLNNHIGAPLSVLQLQPQHRYAVFELGANHLGEIAYTVAIVKPQVALINNIAPAHIEGFGSIDGVARAKGEIYQGLPKEGIAVINDDDDYAHFWDELLQGKKTLRFSANHEADIYVKNLTFDANNCASFQLIMPAQSMSIHLKVPGRHNVHNALAAAACCYALGIAAEDIVRGLQTFNGVAGRMTFRAGKNQSLVIDDTYNANLRSVLTAVDVLAKRQGKRILVLGDMGELGAWTKQHHEEIGHTAQNKGIDLLLTCGINSKFSSAAFGKTAKHYSSQDELARDLLPQLDEQTTVLVKGSRSAAMEKIVAQLVALSPVAKEC